MLTSFFGLIVRDLRLAMRQPGDLVALLFFFLVALSLYPFAVGPEPALLARIAPGAIWVTALLAVMLTLPRLFQDDLRDGSLEQLIIAPLAIEFVVLAKIIAHWCLTGLPLLLLSPLASLILNLDEAGRWTLMATIALGTPSLSFIGAIGAALTLGARRASLLVPLLVLPLYVPVLIFGVGAVDAAIQGFEVFRLLLTLFILMLISAPIAVLACSLGLRLANR